MVDLWMVGVSPWLSVKQTVDSFHNKFRVYLGFSSSKGCLFVFLRKNTHPFRAESSKEMIKVDQHQGYTTAWIHHSHILGKGEISPQSMSFREFFVLFPQQDLRLRKNALLHAVIFGVRRIRSWRWLNTPFGILSRRGDLGLLPGTLETNWLHSMEQSSWVISNENRYLSFLVLFCVTSFSEPSNNMFKLHQGHPSHKVTIPSIFRILRGKGSKFNFCVFFFHRWKLEASEEMGQCCYCWLLKDTKQGLYFTRDRIPKKGRDNVFPPASEKVCYLQDKWHKFEAFSNIIHVLSCSFDWFCPGNPIVLVSLIDLGTRRIVFAPRWGSRLAVAHMESLRKFCDGKWSYRISIFHFRSKFGTTQLETRNWECFNHRSYTYLLYAYR